MGIPSCNSVVAFARIVGTITGDATDLLVRRDLIEKIGKYGRISDAAARDLYRPYLQCFLVDPNMYLAPDAALWATMLACVPLPFAFSFDARAVEGLASQSIPASNQIDSEPRRFRERL